MDRSMGQTLWAQADAHAGLTGKWRKDKEQSDPMEEACDLVELPWLLKKAVLVHNTLELEDTPEFFRTTLKAGGVLDVVERYPWSGEVVLHKRRDKRSGQHRGRVERTSDGHPCILVEWDDPHGGVCSDMFVLGDGGYTLTQLSDMTIRDSGRRFQYKTVFQRAS
ncbi:hypothetical protein WJX81_001129 [Elliptochloris bilobata]|uniref:Uncharacterized protein n=1 Tax=Elliptochloris bilobata TaxID=381761 RepID=A0AAW1QLP2_9CHLO